ncbi:hypothetical protein [Streptomyces sp. NPDC020607]|uniref:hypothetical protein n=1 Tax=Streptomyces sp. NPDC020607 TaxID=3365082 RepID=UPI0037A8679E
MTVLSRGDSTTTPEALLDGFALALHSDLNRRSSEPEGRVSPPLIAAGALLALAAFWAGSLTAHERIRDRVTEGGLWMVTDGALWLVKTAAVALVTVGVTLCVNKVRRWWKRSHR